MTTLRMSGDLRRELILNAAKRCFARHGFAGTTTKSVAVAAKVSEALLFKHFPSKSALYAEILAESCEADPAFHRLLALPASTQTLVILVRSMVCHFFDSSEDPDQEEAHQLRLAVSSQLDDGEFARLLYEKVGALVENAFSAALEAAIREGDAVRIGAAPMNLFWFIHQAVLMISLARMPAVPSLDYGDRATVERQVCHFMLRGIGLTDAAIAQHLDCELPAGLMRPSIPDAPIAESA